MAESSTIYATGTKTTTLNDSGKIDKAAEYIVEGGAPQILDGGSVDGENREPEEALETHEVVELNKFTTKKEWIEEKIKLLESIPPVEVFVAVETLVAMSEDVPPGLPTRAQLDHWLEEHDKTEKETEIFDSEDMSKLKKVTKAATKRNLSPEDTDLIELTLTTLLALDRLLHLLRDRSEMLDLLGLRLTWEEQRVAAWRDRSSILADLRSFLATRARWSPDTYEIPLPNTPILSPAHRFASPSPSPSPYPSPSPSRRRGSAASFTSISSDTSISTGLSSNFSRSARYKLAELLSQDAALFSGRLITLNRGKIVPAGKTLDRLIDASRTPVPDEILDEQDRLEDKGGKEIENVGKFAMAVVMQWKRADEYYNDTKKDQATARELIAELNNAMLQHPTARHAAAFMPRSQALTKRLTAKLDPALSRSSFPRPLHPLFPEQGASNEAVVKMLSLELAEAMKLAHEAETAALAYNAAFEAVKRAELLRDQMRGIEEHIEKLLGSLIQGVHDGDGHGDGSSIDLNKVTCLDPTRHATYLALLPSVMQQLELADEAAKPGLHEGRLALLRLKELPGIDGHLSQELAGAMRALEHRRSASNRAREDVLAQTQRLKEARRLWGVLNDIMRSLEDAKQDAADGMENQRWKVHESGGDAPLTPDPDSPTPSDAPFPTTLSPGTLLQQLDALANRVSTEFKDPFATLSKTLERPLYYHLQSSSEGMSKHIDDIRAVARLWEGILRQSENMQAVKRETHDLEGQIGIIQASVDDARHDVLDRNLALEEAAALEASFRDQASALEASVRKFTDSLAARVPFVSRMDGVRTMYSRSNSFSTFSSPDNQRLHCLKEPPGLALPFELSSLDSGVRAEVNGLALGLAGGMQTVHKQLDYLHLAYLAKITDAALDILTQDVRGSEEALSDIKGSFESTKAKPDRDIDFSQWLSSTREQLDRITQDHRRMMSRSTSPVRQALDALQTARGAHDSPVHGTIVAPRTKCVDETLRRADSVGESSSQLRAQIVEAERHEDARLHAEKQRFEAEERAKLEKERLEAEGKARLEKERITEEEMARQNEERFRKEQEMARLAEASRLEQERLNAETIAMLEKQRVEEESIQASRVHTETEEEHSKTQEKEKMKSREPQPHISIKLDASEDVFGVRLTPSTSSVKSLSEEMMFLRARIMSLRSRLRSLSSSTLALSSSTVHGNPHGALPSLRQALDIQSNFSAIVSDTAVLPTSVEEEASIDSELRSLRSEVDASRDLVQRTFQLGQFADKVAACDGAISDLLEHADSYPAPPPADQLASTHVSDARLPCEEQLANRLTFTKLMIEEMSQLASSLADDVRVVAEATRLQQASTELADMCRDRISGTRSRPTSSISSTGRKSVVSVQRKPRLSLNPHPQHHPRASEITKRRTTSAAHDPIPRPSTHLSNRSVSGPTGFSSLFSSTFSSRQRTTSLASIQSVSTTPMKRPMSPITRPRTASRRPGSPAFSEMSSHSLASTPSRSTWSRAPRQSFGTVPRNFQILDRTPKRKAYVANPRSKLDVAVGNVVNNFKVPVTIQAAGDGWKDQSGNYWIGDAEPKLCFCRILRSQTVMVRVGGGWCELSNFLRGHCAEFLGELSPSPPRKEERWITSATVIEASETPTSIIVSRELKTPEPQRLALLPALQLSTPTGASPRSIKTSSSPGGSPNLTPFQFMRKADPGARAVTPPSKAARVHPITPSAAVTPARTNIWRP